MATQDTRRGNQYGLRFGLLEFPLNALNHRLRLGGKGLQVALKGRELEHVVDAPSGVGPGKQRRGGWEGTPARRIGEAQGPENSGNTVQSAGRRLGTWTIFHIRVLALDCLVDAVLTLLRG